MTRLLGALSVLMALSLTVTAAGAAMQWRLVSTDGRAEPHHAAPARRHVALALPADGPFLHTDGAAIREASGQAVHLSGLNWFGLETCAFAPDGLALRSWGDLLDQVRALGYNTIRLPFSDQLLDRGSVPRYIDYGLNPDLRGLSGLQVMDRIIQGAGERGLRVILDRHRPDCTAQSALWYTPRYPERRWIADLVFLARRYRHQPAVIGLDLHNEPHGPATWGDGNPTTDWRLAAERAGDAVLRVNPHLLIFVEGIQTYHGDIYWWGGNLEGAAAAAVRLAVPHRLVYEAHDYGPGVYWQGWFGAPDFPRNLPRVWDMHWGYLPREGSAPVVLGEFGGRNAALAAAAVPKGSRAQPAGARVAAADGLWQRALVAYLARHGLSFLYWNLTPDSADTGGLLNDDWQSANAAKQALLAPLQGAPLPLPGARPAPAPVRVLVSERWSPGDNQQSLALRLVNDGPRPLSLDHAAMRYWAGTAAMHTADKGHAGGDGRRMASIDWASTGPGTVATAAGTTRGYAYLALRFVALPSGAALAPYGGAATIMLRLHRADWATYDPRGDWSYTPSTAPLASPRLTLMIDGRMLWGAQPPGLPRAHRPGASPLRTGGRLYSRESRR